MEFAATSQITVPSVSYGIQNWKKIARRLWVKLAHRGIDPCYNCATNYLYTHELRRQIEATHDLLKCIERPSVGSKIKFALRAKTGRLKLYSKYHAQELNASETDLLPALYDWIQTIHLAKRNLLSLAVYGRTPVPAEDLKLKSFKLLSELSKESLRFNSSMRVSTKKAA